MCGFFKGDSQKKKGGKMSRMIPARKLSIAWGDDKRYWNWTTMPDSRFPEVAELRGVWWFEIGGIINTTELSPNTQYAAYLVFQMINAWGFSNIPVELSVGVIGGHNHPKIVCLYPDMKARLYNTVGSQWPIVKKGLKWSFVKKRLQWPFVKKGLQCPNVRSDGWLEIEIGEFFSSGLENEEIQMKVKEVEEWKKGIFIEGIEVRPK